MSYSGEVLADSPVGYWKLDETSGTTAADSSGNGHTATYSGTETLGVTGLVTVGVACSFSNGKATTASSTAFQAGTGHAFSVEAWIKTTQTGTGGILCSDTGSGSGRFFQFRVSSGKLQLIVEGSSILTFTSTASVNDGNAHHVVATYDGANVLLYIDGVLDSTHACTLAPNTGSHAVAIGDELAGVTGQPFVGTIDEVAFYATTLSATRIGVHYTAGISSSATEVDVPFISSATVVFDLPEPIRVSQAAVEALYNIASARARVSQEALEVLQSAPPTVASRISQIALEILLQDTVGPPLIPSATIVYPPELAGVEALPFISSVTVVYPPTLTAPVVDVPFIASRTRAYGIMSLFGDETFFGSGNGGEIFPIRLAPNGTTVTATLAANIGAGDTLITLTGDGSFPASVPFVMTIDTEVIYVVQVAPHTYRVRGRAASNTTAAAHAAGATVSWGDSYDMPVKSGVNLDSEFVADVNSTGNYTYRGWLICFDCSQGYLAGARYPMHVAEFLGVFSAGAGSTGTSKCDAAQPNAVSTPTGATTDHCPLGLANPSRITTDIIAGDVGVCRYTNPEASVLDLGPRSVGIQTWYGLGRFEAGPTNVTLTNVNGVVVDTTAGDDTFTSAVITEPAEPLPLAIGVEPEASDDAGHAIPTPGPVPWLTVDEPASDRHYSATDLAAIPIGCLAVRQGNRRVPFWESWDWTNYTYALCGWGDDCTYVQQVIELNGTVNKVLSQFIYPNTDDATGPDAIWDDDTYFYAACWYVCLLETPYAVAGDPFSGGTPPVIGGGPSGSPPIHPGGGGVIFPPPPPGPIIIGGSGGGNIPPGVFRALFQAASV